MEIERVVRGSVRDIVEGRPAQMGEVDDHSRNGIEDYIKGWQCFCNKTFFLCS